MDLMRSWRGIQEGKEVPIVMIHKALVISQSISHVL